MAADAGASFLRAVKEHNNRKKNTHVVKVMKLVHMGDGFEQLKEADFQRPKSGKEIQERRDSSTSLQPAAAAAEESDESDLLDSRSLSPIIYKYVFLISYIDMYSWREHNGFLICILDMILHASCNSLIWFCQAAARRRRRRNFCRWSGSS